MSRTALIAPIRLPSALAALRRQDVEVARLGVPPHVTILSPFLDSDAIDAAVEARLATIIAGVAVFEVTFRTVGRWPRSAFGPGVVWLRPEPADPFVELTRAVWREWPSNPPYGRHDDGLEAHLTISIDDPTRFDGAELEAVRSLPFSRRVSRIALVVEGPTGRWRRRRSFALADAG